VFYIAANLLKRNQAADRLAGTIVSDHQRRDADAKVTIGPLASLIADTEETSGLIFWENQFWTHNDDNDTRLYALDTLYAGIVKNCPLRSITNTDWEELSQDDDHIYIGDFGNNSGNRINLKIFRATKNSVLNNSPVFDSVCFTYSDQADFTPGAYKTDFDCEAFIVAEDSIYLFTKQWSGKGTSVYSLSKDPGNHVAKLRSSFNVKGLCRAVSRRAKDHCPVNYNKG
jgi:hypothetical protein